MEKKITRLAVFDFDGTIADTPLPTTENKALYEQKTGTKWPHKGWWSRPETLDQAIFDIPLISSVIADYEMEKAREDTMVILLTGRISRLSTHVKTILESKGLTFDGHFFNSGGSTLDFKMYTVGRILKDYPSIKELHMWDDRLEHIPSFTAWGEKLKGIDFKITVVEGSHY